MLKVKYSSSPINIETLQSRKESTAGILGLTLQEAGWLVFTGEASSTTYNFEEQQIKILFKNGEVKNISAVDDALINESLRGNIKKYYICYPGY